MRRLLVSVLTLLLAVYVIPGASKENAQSLMQAVDDRYRGDTRIITSRVVLIDKDNKRNHRKIRTVNKMYGDDERGVTFILEPPRLQETGFLTYDWDAPERENEAWIYLPDLGKVTRLSTSNRADYFLGSDFTYGDLERLEVEDFQYRFADDETPEEGQIIIDAVPRADIQEKVVDKTGYTRIRYWIDEHRNMVIKTKYWLRDPGWIKYYSASEIQQLSGVWIAKREQMVLTRQEQKIHVTVMLVESVDINTDVDEGIFTTYGLEKGLQ